MISLNLLFDDFNNNIHRSSAAPNIATEKEFTKEHYENSMLLLKSMNQSVCCSIASSRGLDTFSPAIWQLLRDYGSITAHNAQEIGLVDALSNVNPLDDLIRMNQSDNKESRKKRLHGVDLDKFQADEIITLDKYMKTLANRKSQDARRVKIFHWLSYASTKSSAAESLLSYFGFIGPYFNLSKVSE